MPTANAEPTSEESVPPKQRDVLSFMQIPVTAEAHMAESSTTIGSQRNPFRLQTTSDEDRQTTKYPSALGPPTTLGPIANASQLFCRDYSQRQDEMLHKDSSSMLEALSVPISDPSISESQEYAIFPEASASSSQAIIIDDNAWHTDIPAQLSDAREVGLVNMGQTCYLNALLNALARLPNVFRWARQHRTLCANSAALAGECTLCDLAIDLHGITMRSERTSLRPAIAQHRARWGGKKFNNNRQQDVSEAFIKLVEVCNNSPFYGIHHLRSCSASTRVYPLAILPKLLLLKHSPKINICIVYVSQRGIRNINC